MQGGPSGCEWQVGDDVHEAEIFRPLGIDLWVRYRPTWFYQSMLISAAEPLGKQAYGSCKQGCT